MAQERGDLRSQSLDLLRFPLALFVVAVHVFAPFPFIEHDFEAAQWLERFVRAFIKDQSVPVYFFIAGYVFFLGMRFSLEAYRGKLRRRCSSLLMPYLMWNSAALLYLLKIFITGGDASQLNLSLQAFLESFWDDRYGIVPYTAGAADGTFPIDKPLWFVRDLMLMALASPAIHAIYRMGQRRASAVLGAATLIWALRLPLPGHALQLLEAFVFFAWGGLLSYHKRDMMIEFRRFLLPSAVLYPAVALTIFILSPAWPQTTAYIKSVNIIVGLFFFYNVAAWLLEKGMCRVSKFLASASFFIYCGHFILLDPVTRRLYGLLSPESNAGITAFYLASYACIVFLLLGGYALLRRFAPRILRLFTGGRL